VEDAMGSGTAGRAERFGAAVATILLVIGVASASPVFAGDEVVDEVGTCRDECTEARRMCHAAAHAAFTFCRDECQETMQDAIARALDACRAEGLRPDECDRYVKRATNYAAQECRDDCGKARKRARRVCRTERQECREACRSAPACARECVGEFVGCREGVDACADQCTLDKREGLEECRAMIADTCDPESFRVCVRDVRREYRGCVNTCHEDGSCGDGLHECLDSCVDDADDGDVTAAE
jgi:hypothetical protein